MFKKAFESFFIIDANEKPAPSFLAAYLIAWFFVHKQVITTFISTTGAFDIRLHASIASITENLYMKAFWYAIGFVIIRFALNNLIYFFRESFDHLTQFTLNKLNMKSFIKTTVHQSVLDDLANARGKIHSFHDRATLAEESASQTKNELQTLKNEIEVQHQDNLNALTEKELEIDKIDKSNEVLTGQNNNLKVKLVNSNDELKQLSSTYKKLNDDNINLAEEFNQLNDEHNKSIGEHNKFIGEQTVINHNYKSLVRDNKELLESYAKSKNDYGVLKKKIDIWSKNTNTNELKLLYKNDDDFTTSDEETFSRLITTKIDLPEE
jgi:hypothetical protein